MNKLNNICPIAYVLIEPGEKYSIQGLKKLSPELQNLYDFPYGIEEQARELYNGADQMSIPGVQPKFSATFDLEKQSFTICNLDGNYILKPQNKLCLGLPENEDLTMRLAEGLIEIPLHGLIYCVDGSLTYFIKRFDRAELNNRIPVEDFAQLAGLNRANKYCYSMEKIIKIIDNYCTVPTIEKAKLFTRVIFNYLIGNEDMHLKNFSLLTKNNIVELAPAYDFLNISMLINNSKEQLGLPLNGKKNNLTKFDLIEYYGMKRLELSSEIIVKILGDFNLAIARWYNLINVSFLSEIAKQKYRKLLDQRIKILEI